jgi:hypothetical protein
MPKLQKPIFPSGGTKNISESISVEVRDKRLVYFNGLLPIFQHDESDLQSFRMFTSSLIDLGELRQVDVAEGFGVPLPTIKRYLKLLREHDKKDFYTNPKPRSEAVLNAEVRQDVERLLAEGNTVPEVAQATNIKANTLHKAIRAGRLPRVKKKDSTLNPPSLPTQSERSVVDRAAVMGNGTTRAEERVAAALGLVSEAKIQFCAGQDIAGGGVLTALPSLLVMGLLEHQALYSLPQGFYGLTSIFLLLAFMALSRILSLEKLRYQTPGEWGQLLGLDRIPEVRTLREKVKYLCNETGRAAIWNAALAKEWITADQASDPVFFADGHVRIYHGRQTNLPKHYVPRQKLYHRATVDHYLNAMDGQPFCYINAAVDHGLVAALRDELVPWLEAQQVVSAEHRQRMLADPRVPRFTLVFDREGYSPETFEKLWEEKRVAVITYHRYPQGEWPETEFREHSVALLPGVTMKLKLAEREVQLGRKKVRVREIRRLTEDGRQVSLLSTNLVADGPWLTASLLARWSQENYFRYMRKHFNIDALVERGTETMPDTEFTVNPEWRELTNQIRPKQAQLRRHKAMLGAATLKELTEQSVLDYELQQGNLIEQMDALQKELGELKKRRKELPHHVKVKDLPEKYAFERLRTERKYFLDTIKMIAYRAETTMVSIVREKLARSDDGRALLQQIFKAPADLIPNLEEKTLTILMHHLTQHAHDEALRHLCEELTATETQFPGTDLRLVYKLRSS